MRALLAVAALLTLTSTASAQSYRYHGIRPQHGPVTLQLDTAHPRDGHIAAWFGANDTHGNWVQAGIALETGNPHPFVYLETSRNGHTTLQEWPTQLRHPITVRVLNRHGHWAVRTQGHQTPYVRLDHPTILSVLETYGNATGTATISSQHVKGGSP